MGKNKKIIRCLLWGAVIFLLIYNSIYFKKLNEINAARNKNFDATAYAGRIWAQQLPPRLDSAIGLPQLLTDLHADAPTALDRYTHALDIGNVRYGLVRAGGRVIAVNEDDVALLVQTPQAPVTVSVATEYVYGNAIRDASGVVSLRDFTNTMDLNNIAAALDKRVREDVLPVFKNTVKKGDSLSVAGAVELNSEHLKLDGLTIMPIAIKIH